MGTVARSGSLFKVGPTTVRRNVVLAPYTTFEVGGPADLFAQPATSAAAAELISWAARESIPLFVLGGGANVVVSDRGVRGLVLHTGALAGISREQTVVHAAAGSAISTVSARAADWELAGLDFIYAMPGSTGGAVWMNARCYDGEIAAILASVDYVEIADPDAGPQRYLPRAADFAYKVSPFQDGTRLITAASFSLQPAPGRRGELWQRMRGLEEDRRAKGHFAAPCAGSIFKNNREFGAPSGRIIDEVGLRGFRIGAAQVSDGHGNIVLNSGGATAAEIRAVVTEVRERVYRQTGFSLEPEVLFVGDWT